MASELFCLNLRCRQFSSDAMIRKIIDCISIALFNALFAGLFFGVAGRLNLPFVWVLFSLQAVIVMIGYPFFDPGMIKERRRPPKGQDRDPLGVTIISLLYLLHYWIAAKDLGQWHLSTNVPTGVQTLAVLMTLVGWAGVSWAMATNKFFSSAIRLQSDRGQVVVTEGPYRYIRHPGYAFAALLFFFQGMALGSWLSVLPAMGIINYMLYRTALEEEMLNKDLPGYKEYSRQVRFRWVPGVW